jgi:thiaminase/transcriptional activator TenA
MSFSDELRASVGPLWERVVTHPFVIQLGDNALPQQIFDVYFAQDYLFLKDWAVLLSLAAAKAPDFDAARHLVTFLHLGLGGEEGLFQKFFRERGLSRQDVVHLEYLPTTFHYSGYLHKLAYEGSFIDLITALLGVEWPYLDWAQRLAGAGKHPENYYYQTWIDLHTSQAMSDFVEWLRQTVDRATFTQADRSRLLDIFRHVIRYEFLFWEMAYRGEKWPE